MDCLLKWAAAESLTDMYLYKYFFSTILSTLVQIREPKQYFVNFLIAYTLLGYYFLKNISL